MADQVKGLPKFNGSDFGVWKAVVEYSEYWINQALLEPHRYTEDQKKDCAIRIIPAKTTAFAQPLDVYFNRQVKQLIRLITNQVRANVTLDRNVVISIMSLAQFTLSAPCFRNLFIQEVWVHRWLSAIPNCSRKTLQKNTMNIITHNLDRNMNLLLAIANRSVNDDFANDIILLQDIPNSSRASHQTGSGKQNESF